MMAVQVEVDMEVQHIRKQAVEKDQMEHCSWEKVELDYLENLMMEIVCRTQKPFELAVHNCLAVFQNYRKMMRNLKMKN